VEGPDFFDAELSNYMTKQQWMPTQPMTSNVTLDDYQRKEMFTAQDEDSARTFHHFFLTNCVVSITSTNEYMVRVNQNGHKVWVAMGKNHLKKILDKLSMTITFADQRGKQKRKKVLYSEYLEDPVVTQTMVKFEGRDFMRSSRCPDCFPAWQGHKFPKVEEVNMELIQPFIDHVRDVICSGNPQFFETEMKKNAWIVQNPILHMDWATVLVGVQGTGKTIYCNILCNLWGEAWTSPNVTVKQVTDATSSTIIHYKKLVVCNELPRTSTRTGQHTEWDTLKSRITDNYIKVREMYHDFDPNHQERNVTNYMFCTNNLDSLPMTQDDRRFFVLQVSDEKAKDVAYFEKLFRLSLDPEFLTHLLSYLLDYDCSGFNTHVPPMSDVKLEMIEATEDYSLQYIKLRRWRKGTTDHTAWVPFKPVWSDYLDWLNDEVGADSAKVAGANNRFTGPLKLGKWIEKKDKKPVEIRPGRNLLKIWQAEDEKAKKEKEDRLRQDLLAGNSEEDVELTLEFRRKREELDELAKRMKKVQKKEEDN
jgi:hypothetical protein